MYVDLTGMRFGRLVTLERVGKTAQGSIWLCQCDCGNQTKVRVSYLRNGHTKSCGCYATESKHLRKTRTTHGQSYESIYQIWQSAKQRCYYKNNANYKHYGGRGIEMCAEWRDSFETFFEWAKNNGYAEGLTIDRIDVNGNYCPENCRWVNMTVQNRNKTTSVFITLDGVTRTQSEWGKLLGIPTSTMTNRRRKGLPAELILWKGSLRNDKKYHSRG